MTLGEKLVLLRKARGMTQEQLAAELSVSRQAVSKWELGEATPETENVMQLSRLFGVTTDYLLFEAETGAASAPAPLPHPKQEKPARRAARIAGWAMAAFGALGLLVIWMLSTMIPSYERYSYTAPDGTGVLGNRTVYAFDHFVETYRLGAVVFLLALCLCTGMAVLLWRWYKNRQAA